MWLDEVSVVFVVVVCSFYLWFIIVDYKWMLLLSLSLSLSLSLARAPSRNFVLVIMLDKRI